MCALTSVVSTPGNQHCTLPIVLPGLHELDLRNIKFKRAHLKITVYGHKQASKQAIKQAYTHTCTMQ